MFNIETRSVTFNLIVINVLVFITSQFVGEKMYDMFALYYPANPNFKPIQLVKHMFMHGNWIPQLRNLSITLIFSNMFGLLMFGPALEQVWGARRFLFFYLFSGFGAVALHLGVQAFIIWKATGTVAPSVEELQMYHAAAAEFFVPTVGASGAIFGILTGFGLLNPNAELIMFPIPIPIKAKFMVIIYAVIELTMGIAAIPGDNVAHYAHLGGALFGFILIKIWGRNRFQRY